MKSLQVLLLDWNVTPGWSLVFMDYLSCVNHPFHSVPLLIFLYPLYIICLVIYPRFLNHLPLNSSYSLNSSFKFLEDLYDFGLPIGYVLASLDVVAPFNLVCSVINDIWPTPSYATDFEDEEITELIKFCLTSDCFVFSD